MAGVLQLLVNLLLVDPLQAGVAARLGAAGGPPELVARTRTCIASSLPALARRVGDDPLWGISTAAGIWLGYAPVERVVDAVTPACGAPLRAVRAI